MQFSLKRLSVLLLGFRIAAADAPASDAPGAWATAEEAAAAKAELRAFFEGSEVRFPGMPGNLRVEEKVAGLFADSGMEHGQIVFRAPVFVPGSAELTVAGQTPIRLRPIHPTLFRPGNLAERDFGARLVYLDARDPDCLLNLKGRALEGTIGLMDFNRGGAWQRYMRLGIKGFVFIGEDRYEAGSGQALVHGTEVSVPRFFVASQDGRALKAALTERGGELPIRIRSEPSRWTNMDLRNLWAFIPGSDKALSTDVILLLAPMDSNCAVPELAVGAEAGANLHLLLRLFEQFRKAPPARSVLFAAVNARTQSLRGDRLLAWNLLAPSAKIEQVRNTLAGDLRLERLAAHAYSRLSLQPADRRQDEDYLIELRTLTDNSLGRTVTVKETLVDRVKRETNRLLAQQFALSESGRPADEVSREKAAIEDERQKNVRVLTLFNKVGAQTTLGELYDRYPESVELLRRHVQEILERNRKWASLDARDLELNSANAGIRGVLNGRRLAFALSLEFDWTSDQIGFGSADPFGVQRNWQTRFGRNTVEIAARLPAVTRQGKPNLLVDTMTKLGGLPEIHYFPNAWNLSAISIFHAANATPAFSLRNVWSVSPRPFTPADTFENLNGASIATIANYLPPLLRAALSNPNLTLPSELPPYRREVSARNSIWSVQVKTFKYDPFAASVLPTVPVPDASVILYGPSPVIDAAGVVNAQVAMTDERAATVFYGLTQQTTYRPLSSSAFHYDPDFVAVDHALDAGDAQTRVNSNLLEDDTSVRLALFPCVELPVYTRADSSLVSAFPIDNNDYLILDGARNSAPRKYGFTGIRSLVSSKQMPDNSGPFAVYANPGAAVKILTGKFRGVLNTSTNHPLGVGVRSPAELGEDFFAATARDLSRLNWRRIGDLKGVSDELAREFLRRGDDALRAMGAARAARDPAAYLRQAQLALGAQAKAYRQTTGVTNDMLKAVVFYMALLLPFCFFLQRLLFKTSRIEVEMGLFAGLFVLTYVVFRFVHPAFRVAQAPEAMFIAFVMGALGLFVIQILRARFEGEMQLLFQTYSSMDRSSVTYSTAGQQAMLVGVNNMKRRRVRTALTTGTIVLVTFTMLSFTSISTTMSPTIVSQGQSCPYTGILYHWPGQPMDAASAEAMANMFQGKADIILRNWLLSPRTAGSRPIRVPMKVRSVPSGCGGQLDALLGLSTREDGLIGRLPILPGGRFFSSDDAFEAILPTATANALGISADSLTNATVRFRGADFRVVGILDDDRFRTLRDIDGRPLTPVQAVTREQDQADTAKAAGVEQEDKAGIEYVNLSALMILPLKQAGLLGCAPYSIVARFHDDTSIWPYVEDLLTATEATFYVSSRTPFRVGGEKGRRMDPGSYYVGSGYRTSIGGLAVLIIPLLIAATIILNTMLGSVYERRSEIAVYNAVGLNPTHIGMFFLAEAFVYSVIGSVGGYLIGQVLSMALNKFHLITNVNLNFSSLSVVYVILFTIGVVLLSTLYPAHVATKAAVPSGKRKWSLPPHDGTTMRVAFPFIYQAELLPGIMNYLEAYFARFSEASIGDLIAQVESKTAILDADGRHVFDLRYRVALAPFDLGVTQTAEFQGRYDAQVDAYKVLLEVTRLSGQDTNWVATNRPFLEAMRRHMMHWRNLSPQEQAVYAEQGRGSFGTGV